MKRLLLIILLIVGCGDPTPDLICDVEIDWIGEHSKDVMPTFVITNKDTFDWRGCDFTYNDDYIMWNKIGINKGEEKHLRWDLFKNYNNGRFMHANNFQIPQVLYIRCRNHEGKIATNMTFWNN